MKSPATFNVGPIFVPQTGCYVFVVIVSGLTTWKIERLVTFN